MKWPLAVMAAGVVVVIAAIIVNEADTPDEAPGMWPAMATTPMFPTTGTEPSMAIPSADAKAHHGLVFDLVRVAPDGHTVIAGQAEPGSRVTVLDGDTPLGDVIADARGEWVFLPRTPLKPGEHWLGLQVQAQDRKAVLSQDLMVVVVPEPGEDIVGRAAQRRD